MIDRRTFCSAAVTMLLARAGRANDDAAPLRFGQDGRSFRFNTGALRGVVRQGGRSMGLNPLFDGLTDAPLAASMGVFSHYRLLDADTRYGPAAWDWLSTGKTLDDGALQTDWAADETHPFDMRAVYRWSAPDTLDLTTTVTARKPLRRFEVFLASYFDGFARAFVYAGLEDAAPRFIEAVEKDGVWQLFPRDDDAAKINEDGRWNRPPHPVDWTVRPRFAKPLALRRDAKTGLAAVVMSPAEDCFGVLTPYGEETHRSLYLSLIGRDLEPRVPATARARLVVGKNITDPAAVRLYESYVEDLKRGSP